MSDSFNSPPAAAGGNTATPAAPAAPAHPSATPASVGGFHPAPKPNTGATTSRRSARPHTTGGKRAARRPAPPAEVRLPYVLATSAHWLYRQQGAHEILVFDGGGRLIVGPHDAELQPGRYLVVRLEDESDGLPPNALYRVPDDGQG